MKSAVSKFVEKFEQNAEALAACEEWHATGRTTELTPEMTQAMSYQTWKFEYENGLILVSPNMSASWERFGCSFEIGFLDVERNRFERLADVRVHTVWGEMKVQISWPSIGSQGSEIVSVFVDCLKFGEEIAQFLATMYDCKF